MTTLTAARLRSLTTTWPVLACSPVRLIGPDGTEYVIARPETHTPARLDKDGHEVPAGVPTLTLRLRPKETQ